MKKIALLVFTLGVSLVTFAQQIPFQGRLLENGTVVNGTKDFNFTIDVDGTIWTETHAGVAVSEGLYSVVLGSSTPLPNNLYYGTDTRSLEISVGGVALTPINIHASPNNPNYEYVGDGSVGMPSLNVNMTGNFTGSWAAIESSSTTTNTNNYAIYGYSSGAINNNTGLYGYSTGGAKYNRGLYGIGLGSGNGATGKDFGVGSINFGVEGNASGNTWNNTGVEGSNYGTAGEWNFGVHGISKAGTGTTVENHGVGGRAYGPGINYGVWGAAFGGVQNWAGWFDGAVMVNNGQLKLNNVNGNQAATLKLNAQGGGMLYTFNNFGTHTGWFGNLNDQGGFVQLVGDDGLGNVTGAMLNGFWDGTGNARLMMEDENARQLASMNIDDGTGGKAGTLFTYGPNTPNLEMRGKGWEDNDLPTIQMFGQHTDGGSWYHANARYEVNTDGTNNWGQITLSNSTNGGTNNNTVEIDGGGSRLTLRSPDGLSEVTIDAYNGVTGGPTNANYTNLDISDPGILGGQGFASINIVNDGVGADPSGYSGQLFLQGTNTPNVQLGGKMWENNNLPFMNLFGSTPDGNGWYQANLHMSIGSDGTDEWAGLTLHKTNIAGQTIATTINLDGQNGNIGVSGNISAAWFDSGPIVIDGVASGNMWGVNEITATSVVAGDAFDNSVQMSGTNFSIFSGGTGADDGTETILLNGAGGNINVSGSISAPSLDSGPIVIDGAASGRIWGINEIEATSVVAGDAFDNGVQMSGTNFSIFSGGTGVDDGTETILLDGANGNIGVTGDVSGANLNGANVFVNDVVTQQVNASIQVQAGDFFGGTGSILFASGDVDATGNMSALSFNVTSDKRFKKNIKTIPGALSITNELRGVTYNWRENEFSNRNFNDSNQIGVIAQEVEQILPELVHTDDKGFKSVNYAQMTAVLIEAVKELNQKVEELSDENNSLKAEVSKISNTQQLDTLQKQLEQLTARFNELVGTSASSSMVSDK